MQPELTMNYWNQGCSLNVQTIDRCYRSDNCLVIYASSLWCILQTLTIPELIDRPSYRSIDHFDVTGHVVSVLSHVVLSLPIIYLFAVQAVTQMLLCRSDLTRVVGRNKYSQFAQLTCSATLDQLVPRIAER